MVILSLYQIVKSKKILPKTQFYKKPHGTLRCKPICFDMDLVWYYMKLIIVKETDIR